MFGLAGDIEGIAGTDGLDRMSFQLKAKGSAQNIAGDVAGQAFEQGRLGSGEHGFVEHFDPDPLLPGEDEGVAARMIGDQRHGLAGIDGAQPGGGAEEKKAARSVPRASRIFRRVARLGELRPRSTKEIMPAVTPAAAASFRMESPDRSRSVWSRRPSSGSRLGVIDERFIAG